MVTRDTEIKVIFTAQHMYVTCSQFTLKVSRMESNFIQWANKVHTYTVAVLCIESRLRNEKLQAHAFNNWSSVYVDVLNCTTGHNKHTYLHVMWRRSCTRYYIYKNRFISFYGYPIQLKTHLCGDDWAFL